MSLSRDPPSKATHHSPSLNHERRAVGSSRINKSSSDSEADDAAAHDEVVDSRRGRAERVPCT
jgi:hypothetical protein